MARTKRTSAASNCQSPQTNRDYMSNYPRETGGSHSQSCETIVDFSESIQVDKAQIEPTAHVQWKGTQPYNLIWDLLGIIIAICFLVLGIFVAALKDKPETPWSIRIVQATQVAPSIWPILFSGVLGNMLRGLAEWRVERGITLMDLEQLMGSLTMAGSLVTIFRWSLFRPASMALILLWAFNPLGSQATLRASRLSHRYESQIGQVKYWNHNLSTQLDETFWQSEWELFKPQLRGLYSTALYDIVSGTQYMNRSDPTFENIVLMLGGQQTAGIQAAMDQWGNIRIPNLTYLPDYDPSNPERWINTPWMESIQEYASLIGDKFEGLNRTSIGNTTFNITSSFQKFSCSPWLKFDGFKDADQWTLANLQRNLSILLSPRTDIQPLNFFVTTSLNPGTAANASNTTQNKLVYGSLNRYGTREPWLAITECSSGTTYVDAQVTCITKGVLGKSTCGVHAIRQMVGPSDSPESSVLDFSKVPFENRRRLNSSTILQSFLNDFVDILDARTEMGTFSGNLRRILHNPAYLFEQNSDMFTYEYSSSNVDIKVFEQRLALLYNTLWKAGWTYRSAMGGNMTTLTSGNPFLNTTSATVFPLEPVYAINMPWMILYFVSVAIMFLAAVFSITMHYRCQAPPILGFVSSLVRDSAYFSYDGMQGNSAEDGADKARRLGSLQVMVADVRGENKVGRIALAPMETGSRVRKGRWYE